MAMSVLMAMSALMAIVLVTTFLVLLFRAASATTMGRSFDSLWRIGEKLSAVSYALLNEER